MYNTFIVFLAVTVTSNMVDNQQYCTARYKRLCQGKGRHVACQFPTAGPGDSCQNYTQIIFTRDLRLFITNYLNRRRQKLAAGNERVRGGARLPRPQIMMQVEWDRELATLAQRLADQCTFVHDDCRATVRYPYAGQTVGEVRWRTLSKSGDIGVQRAIRRVFDAWWGERRRVMPMQMTEPFKITSRGSVWGHFTQLATWSLRAVGCGAVKHGALKPRVLLVCDFSHTNMLGQRTISPGPLSECPVHTVRRPRTLFPLLCAPVRQSEFMDYTPISDMDMDYMNYGDNIRDIASLQPDVDEETTVYLPQSAKYLSTMDTMHFSYMVSDRQYQTQARELNMRRTTSAAIGRLQNELISSTFNWRTLRPDDLRNTQMNRNYNKLEQEGILNIRDFQPDEMQVFLQDSESYEYVADKMATTEREKAQFFSPIRHRWQHTRERPLRPGVKALLITSTRKLILPPEKYASAQVSLNMDEEDAAQFYIDTGFKPDWRERPKRIISNHS